MLVDDGPLWWMRMQMRMRGGGQRSEWAEAKEERETIEAASYDDRPAIDGDAVLREMAEEKRKERARRPLKYFPNGYPPK